MKRLNLLSAGLVLLFGTLLVMPASAQNSEDRTKATTLDAIQTELAHRKISLHVKETPFREVINLFRQEASFNIVLSKEAESMLTSAENVADSSNTVGDTTSPNDSASAWGKREKQNDSFSFSNDEGQESRDQWTNTSQRSGSADRQSNARKKLPAVASSVTISLNDVRLGQALKTILDQKQMTAVWKNGVVKIVPEAYASTFDTRFYNVQDLLHEIKDFRGPVLKLQNTSSEGSENRMRLGTEKLYRDTPSNSGKKNPFSDHKEFTKLVRNNVGNGGWERGGNIRIQNGVMVVHQAPHVHKEITHLLKRLRQFR